LLAFSYKLPAQKHIPIEDVQQAFNAISQQSEIIEFDMDKYTIPESGGHYQGVQVVKTDGKKYAFISGSSDIVSYYFTIELNGNSKVTAFNSIMPKPMKHAGGFQIIGKNMFIGIEDDKARTVSKILIYDISNPTSANHQSFLQIERKGAYQQATAGAVAVTDLGKQHLLFVGTWDNKTIDIYQSNSKSLDDPECVFKQEGTWVSYIADRSQWIDDSYGSYQNMNFIKQRDGKLFLIAFCETKEGKNTADLFEVNPSADVPIKAWLVKKATRIFDCQKTSFRSGSGVHVTENGEIEIYSCAHHGNVLEYFSSEK
jgi:hypothetical protein